MFLTDIEYSNVISVDVHKYSQNICLCFYPLFPLLVLPCKSCIKYLYNNKKTIQNNFLYKCMKTV